MRLAGNNERVKFSTLRTTALLIFGILATGAPSVRAAVVEGDASGTFQAWTDRSKMPTPPVVVVRAGAPTECGWEFGGDLTNPACVLLPETIIITKPRWINRWTFYHEMGHVFDAELLTESERSRFLELIRLPGRPWEYSEVGVDIHDTSPQEFFADAWAECAEDGITPSAAVLERALPLKFGPRWIEDPRQFSRICRLIDSI